MSQNPADKPPAGWWSAPGAQRAGRAGRAGSSQGSGFKAPPPWEVRSHRRGRRLTAKKNGWTTLVTNTDHWRVAICPSILQDLYLKEPCLTSPNVLAGSSKIPRITSFFASPAPHTICQNCFLFAPSKKFRFGRLLSFNQGGGIPDPKV